MVKIIAPPNSGHPVYPSVRKYFLGCCHLLRGYICRTHDGVEFRTRVSGPVDAIRLLQRIQQDRRPCTLYREHIVFVPPRVG